MERKTARDIMTAPAITIQEDVNLETAAERMLERDVGALAVVDGDGTLVGILTDSDFIARHVGVPFSTFRVPQVLGEWLGDEDVEEIYRAARNRRVEEIMSSPVYTVSEDDGMRTILDVMVDRDVKHVPVVRDGRPVGMVARHDLLRLLHEEGTP